MKEEGDGNNHEIISNKPESEGDTSETIEPTRPKQIFIYDTLGKPPYHNT